MNTARPFRPTPMISATTCSVFAAGALLLATLALPGCASDTKKPRSVEPIVRDIPSVLKGTIGSETSLRGIEPLLVSGYGVVVGLNGTGGGPYPEAISATMERELARGGIGRGGPLAEGPLAGRTPRQVLADPNVAVVIVEGVVVAGAPKETRFDVRVRSLPGSAITNLEGGTLWSTDLRIGPVTPFGSMRTRKIAEARGQLFINPYNDPSSTDGSGRRDVARVLSGGVVTDPLALEITLDNPSYPRSASIKSSINSRFPSSAGDATDTASAKSASSVQVRVPRAWVDRPEEFLRLLEATRVETAFAEEFAKRYTDELVKQPVLAEELHWCLRAIGKPAAPFVRPLYDSAESIPRWAAVRVGAAVGDPLVTPHLLSIASGASGESLSMRAEAARLMGRLPSDPRLALALRKLASSGPLELRTAAYESLAERGDPTISRIRVGKDIRSFYVDTIPAEDPLIYVVQTQRPRLVIFGEGLKLARPVIASLWSDRLMVATDPSPTDGPASKDESLRSVRILFRDWRSEKTINARAPETLKDFVRFLAQQPSPENPEPGLGLTYSEVVGVLYQLQRQTAVQAAFATDEDRLAASISVASTKTYVEPRPESEEDRQKIEAERDRMGDRTSPDGTPTAPAGKGEPPDEPRFIPVPPKKKE